MLDLLPEHLHDLLDLGSLVDVVLDLDRPLVVHERKAWECASRSFAPINGCSKINPILGASGTMWAQNGHQWEPYWSTMGYKGAHFGGTHMGQNVGPYGPKSAPKGPTMGPKGP